MATLSITARTAGSAELIKTQALAVLMPERKTLAPALKALDKRLGGTVTRSLQNGDFTGSAGSQLWLPGAGSVDRVCWLAAATRQAQRRAIEKSQ